MTHPQFTSQAAYDKTHQRIKELKKAYLSKELKENDIKDILRSELGYSDWGANHFIQNIKDETEANKKRMAEIKKTKKLIKESKNPDEIQEMKSRIKYLEMMIQETK